MMYRVLKEVGMLQKKSDQLAGRVINIHEGLWRKINFTKLIRKHKVFRVVIKLKQTGALTDYSKVILSPIINNPLFYKI